MFRMLLAPLILRFKDTESLRAAYNLLGRVDNSKLDAKLVAEVKRTRRIIARELLRRPEVELDFFG